MAQSDLEVNRNVRRVFVRHWLDLGRLFIRSINGRVSIRGSISRITGVKEPLTPMVVETIFNDIKRINNVKDVTADLDNWSNDRGVWKAKDTEKKTKTPQTGTPTQSDSSKRYIIGSDNETKTT